MLSHTQSINQCATIRMNTVYSKNTLFMGICENIRDHSGNQVADHVVPMGYQIFDFSSRAVEPSAIRNNPIKFNCLLPSFKIGSEPVHSTTIQSIHI